MLNLIDLSPDKPPAHFTEHLSYWLQLVARHVTDRLAGHLAEKNRTVNEWLVLRLLSGSPCLPYHVVARTLSLGRAATWKTVARLEAEGLICRELAPGAVRAQELSLTPEGEALVPELAALADDNEFLLFVHLEPGVHDLMIRTLEVLADRHDFGIRRIPRRVKKSPVNRL